MKLLRTTKTKTKITKDQNGGNFPPLKTDEVVLVHSNIFNNDYQLDLKAL